MRLQVGHDGSAVGLPKGLESCAELEEQGKGCWCNTSGYGFVMMGNDPVALPFLRGKSFLIKPRACESWQRPLL